MNAYITGGFNCGFGSIYDSIYRFYNTQEYLKKLGYSVKIYVDFGLNYYRVHNNNREFIKKIFNMDLFDNIVLSTSGFNPHEENFSERNKCELILNKDRIYYVYVDEKVDGLENIEDYHDWQKRDDLPKINMFSDEVMSFCEEKSKNFKDDIIIIHYRPFEYQDQLEVLKQSEKEIDDIILNNLNKTVCLLTPFESVKKYFNNKKYSNLFVNPYDFTEHYEIRGLELPDDELVSYLKEISFEMNLISKSKKIYRLGCSWFSNFLFHSCTFNQTNLSNKDRYFPPYN